MDKATLIIPKCLYIAVWMQLVDKPGQQEAAMVVIVNKVATVYMGCGSLTIFRGKISKRVFLLAPSGALVVIMV